MADKLPPPPSSPPPPPPKRRSTPPPPTPPPPPAPKPQTTPPAPPKPQPTPPTKSPPSPKPRAPRPSPKRRGKRPPKGKKPAPPKKGKPGQPPVGQRKRKGRRIKIKLGLRAKNITKEIDTYTDQVGWTSSTEVLLEDLEDFESDIEEEGPETMIHQCSMCGVRMMIPTPKRDRYKVICAYPECGHEDMIGIE